MQQHEAKRTREEAAVLLVIMAQGKQGEFYYFPNSPSICLSIEISGLSVFLKHFAFNAFGFLGHCSLC